MSAITGILTCFTISLKARAASISGTAGRMMSHPTSSSSFICRTVAFTSRVSVLVMDWTVMGALPPTVTSPTCIGLETLRGLIWNAPPFPLWIAISLPQIRPESQPTGGCWLWQRWLEPHSHPARGEHVHPCYPIDTKNCGTRGPSIWRQRDGTVVSHNCCTAPGWPASLELTD